MKHDAPNTDVTHTDLAHESAGKHVTGRANSVSYTHLTLPTTD